MVLSKCLIKKAKSGEAHYPQSSKKECQAKWIPPSSQGSLQSPNPRRFIKALLNTSPVFQSNPRYLQRGSINGDAPRTPKRQKRAMDNRRNSGTRKKAKLSRPWCRPKNVKTLLPVRGSRQQDFEGLLWGQRIWVPWPISTIKPKGPGRGGKRPKMAKEGPMLLGEITETVMSSANWCHEKKRPYTIHSSPPRRSQTKGLA